MEKITFDLESESFVNRSGETIELEAGQILKCVAVPENSPNSEDLDCLLIFTDSKENPFVETNGDIWGSAIEDYEFELQDGYFKFIEQEYSLPKDFKFEVPISGEIFQPAFVLPDPLLVFKEAQKYFDENAMTEENQSFQLGWLACAAWINHHLNNPKEEK